MVEEKGCTILLCSSVAVARTDLDAQQPASCVPMCLDTRLDLCLSLSARNRGLTARAWLTAVLANPARALSPQAMQVALKKRLRLGPTQGAEGVSDALGDHTLACPRTGLLARRSEEVERA